MNAHLNELNTKLSSLCYAFRIPSNSVSLYTARCVYFANVHSRLRYGIIFWGNTSYSSQTFRLQKRIVRIISKSNPRDSCKSLFINLGFYHYLVSSYLRISRFWSKVTYLRAGIYFQQTPMSISITHDHIIFTKWQYQQLTTKIHIQFMCITLQHFARRH